MSGEKKVTRKAGTPIKVYCLPEERLVIEENARRAGMSASRFLLQVGQGYKVSGVVDQEQVRELVRINGDLGRLGGLLKLWLTNDVRTAQFGENTIRALLSRTEATQDQMVSVMAEILQPKKTLAAKNGVKS